MEITLTLLEQKKAEYTAARDQHSANAAMFSGAIQDIDFWLGKLAEQPPAVVPPTEPPPTTP